MAANKKSKTFSIVAVRFPAQLIEAVDDVIPHLDKEHWEGTSMTRSDAIRYLIRAGIESVTKKEET